MRPKQQPVGQHIRSNVIPADMSVKEAAARLGVGRPALSNLLNGKAALSEGMALRLEKAFGADGEALRQLQAQQDRAAARKAAASVAVRRYVPRPLMVQATDLHHWADTMQAREDLPVLLRKLVHETGQDLQRVDFPGGANSQRKGWDGWVEAGSATAWIPAGESGWEFGTSRNPRRKAEGDYAKRLGLPLDERARCVFVFVTPRNWPGKTEWAREKEASGNGWKAVRAYDASDLEQWLDESVVAPVWLGEKLGARIAGTKTLDQCWADWAHATEPKMTGHIFDSSVEACVRPFKTWLEAPPRRTFTVASDSEEETLAFLACLFEHDEIPPGQRDLAAVFERAETLAELAASSVPFIAIAGSAGAQQPMASLRERVHCIVVCPRNAVDEPPDYALELLDYRAFEKGVEAMGFGRHEVERLARESGRSPTILRRRHAALSALRSPLWASDHALARDLVPLCLVGVWNTHAGADREVLATLADCEANEIDARAVHLQQIDGSPMWAIGGYQGVTSKVDVLFGVAGLMTEQHIRDLFELAEYVLSESDPALDLPEGERWAAAVHGKLREHSAALRDSLCETLVLLSVHGNDLFQERLGVDVEALVSDLVERLLTPLEEKLPSQERDLPSYAEAAPDRFLDLLEADLQKDAPALLAVLKPVSNSPFEPCPRSGLLWSLECLGWDPDHLGRVALLLAKLSRIPITDNIVQKPISSLASLIRSWKPQTAASIGERLRILDLVTERHPVIGWQLCLGEIMRGPRFAIDNYRPRWRSGASGAGGVASRGDFHAMAMRAAEILVSWKQHDQKTLGDLVQHLDSLTSDQQRFVWDRIDAWAATQADDQKAALQGRIRGFVGRGKRSNSRSAQARARVTYDRLQPLDPVWRHRWLFTEDWPRDVWQKGKAGGLYDEAERARIDRWRDAAMKEILRVHGFGGALKLVEEGGGGTVGRHVARLARDAIGVLRECLRREDSAHFFDTFMQAFIATCADPAESDVLRELSTRLSDEQTVRLWRCAPFRRQTWRALDSLPEGTRLRYWKTVAPVGWVVADPDCAEVVERLCEVGRPAAAFKVVGPWWDRVETGCLRRLLVALLGSGEEDSTRIDAYDISAALGSLAARGVVTEEEMASLEFGFIEALEGSEHGIPNLERQLAKHPRLFVRMLAYVYKREDDGHDPPEWHVEGEAKQGAWMRAYNLLRLARRAPGTDEDDALQRDLLWRWLTEARDLCLKHGRSAVGDRHIGDLLAKAPADDDGAPSAVVCEALDRLRSDDVAFGFLRGELNKRGVVVGWGGDQDRELAAEFRRRAQSRRATYPFASSIINRVAEHYDQNAKREDAKATLARRLNTLGG